jgi:NADPH2:quinone reductase
MSNDYRAVVCRALGDPEALTLERLPREPLGPGRLRLRIEAAGVNFPDLLMVQGRYQHKPPLPFVPGLEAAGTVVEVSEYCPFRVGDAVFAPMSTGGYAEEAVIGCDAALPVPSGFSFAEGATFHAAHITAFHALCTRGRLEAGQRLLVLGAAGGVGLAAVQLGRALGAVVIAAASTAGKLDVAARHGAHHLVNYAEATLEDAVSTLTNGDGVDLVLDPVGADAVSLVRCVAWAGRILVAGFAGGTIPTYPANRLLLKGASLDGVRAGEAGRRFPELRRQEYAALLALVAEHDLRPHVSELIPLKEFGRALALLAQRRAVGRIALVPHQSG